MKNKTGKIIGFILGMGGFMLWFKIFILPHTTPEDEAPPGLVLLASIFSGVVFGFVGNVLQNYLGKKEI
jgi:hypothetical protein